MANNQNSVSKMLWRPSGNNPPKRPGFRESSLSNASPSVAVTPTPSAEVPFEAIQNFQIAKDNRRLYAPVRALNSALSRSAFHAKPHLQPYNSTTLSLQSTETKILHPEKKRSRSTYEAAARPLPSFPNSTPREISAEERSTRQNVTSNETLSGVPTGVCSTDVPILYNNAPCPITFIVHKILEFLQEKKQMLSLAEVENHFKKRGYVGLHIKTNKELFQALQANERILYDVARKKLAFVNPYERVVSSEALLASIYYDGGVTGLRVTDDLLSAHVLVKDWIHDLLVNRRIRCIRPNNSHLRGKLKCMFASSEKTCGLYSKKKCKACFENLKGLLLYPLGDEEFESARLRIDPDVKTLWDSIELPAMETILKDYNIDMPVPKWQQEAPREKRGKATSMGRFFTKMRRIQNTHLFTAEELRGEIQQQQLSSWGSAINP